MGHYLDIIIKDEKEYVCVCSKGMRFLEDNNNISKSFIEFKKLLWNAVADQDDSNNKNLGEAVKTACLGMTGKQWMRNNTYFDDFIADEMVLINISEPRYHNKWLEGECFENLSALHEKYRNLVFKDFTNGCVENKIEFDNDFEKSFDRDTQNNSIKMVNEDNCIRETLDKVYSVLDEDSQNAVQRAFDPSFVHNDEWDEPKIKWERCQGCIRVLNTSNNDFIDFVDTEDLYSFITNELGKSLYMSDCDVSYMRGEDLCIKKDNRTINKLVGYIEPSDLKIERPPVTQESKKQARMK